jgi:hypothetical protein
VLVGKRKETLTSALRHHTPHADLQRLFSYEQIPLLFSITQHVQPHFSKSALGYIFCPGVFTKERTTKPTFVATFSSGFWAN